MAAPIKVRLHQLSSEKAIVTLTGPSGESTHEFELPWVDSKEWLAIFSSLKLYSQDKTTWPTKMSKAEEMSLFVNGHPSSARLKLIGKSLYERVFGNEKIRRVFSSLLQRSDEVHLVQFHLPDAGSRLHAYPWELLHDGHDFLFASRRAFLVRYIDFGQPIPTIPLNSALQVLLLDPRPDLSAAGYPMLPLLDRKELQALANEHPDQFTVSYLTDTSKPSKPTLLQLTRDLRDLRNSRLSIHILHIDTHGDFGWLCDQCKHLNVSGRKTCNGCNLGRPKNKETEGYLAFYGGKGKPTWVSGHKLGRQLHRQGIVVAVLAACKSGQVGGSSAFNSIAGALIKQGIPAVIAMQFAIDDEAAAIFIETLYAALMQENPLTEAVAEARRDLLALSDDSWYRPVLYLRTDPANYRGQIFRSKPAQKTQSPPITREPTRFNASQPHLPNELKKTSPELPLEAPDGPVPPNSSFYIERQADRDCWNYLQQRQPFTLFVQGPRQVGKSSLMQHITHRAKQEFAIDTAFIDFDKFTEQQLRNEEEFLIQLCIMIGEALHIPEAIKEYWKNSISHQLTNIIKCSNYISKYIIPKLNQPFILAMDSTERLLLNSPFQNDFFGMLRSWHEERAQNSNLTQMSLFLSSSIPPHIFIDNPNQTPFNVPQTILLHDFTLSEVTELNRRHLSPLNQDKVQALMNLLGGHPFLTRLAFYLFTTKHIQVQELQATAISDMEPFGKHLREQWHKISNMPQVKQSLSLIYDQTHPQNKMYYRLKGAGLVKKVDSQVVMRNDLYKNYFKEYVND